MTSQPASASGSSALDRLLARRVEVNWELVAYAAIFAAAFVLRFWDLGARALHHDESIHALWSWNLAQGSYTHNPVFHGPLLYFVQGFTFLVSTATDYTSRISPALFGMAVVAIPLALRRWLGPVGTLAVVAFLAFSPTVVYFSRFLRMDIYLAFFILLMVVAVWSYLHNGRTRWLIVFVIALALAFSTKEAAFLFVAFLLLYLNGYLALELAAANLQARKADTLSNRLLLAAALYPFAWVLAGLWRYLKRLRRRAAWGDLPRTGDLLVLTGSLTLPLLTAFAKGPLEVIFAAGPLDYPEVCANPSTRAAAVLVTAFVVVCGVAAFAGLSWRPRTWLTAAAIGAIIYLTLMTSLWSNPDGVSAAAPGAPSTTGRPSTTTAAAGSPGSTTSCSCPPTSFSPSCSPSPGGAWAMCPRVRLLEIPRALVRVPLRRPLLRRGEDALAQHPPRHPRRPPRRLDHPARLDPLESARASTPAPCSPSRSSWRPPPSRPPSSTSSSTGVRPLESGSRGASFPSC